MEELHEVRIYNVCMPVPNFPVQYEQRDMRKIINTMQYREIGVLHVAVGHNARLVPLGHALVEKHMFTVDHTRGSGGSVRVRATFHRAGPGK